MKYTWHHDRDGYGTLLEAEKRGEGFLIVNNGIKYEDAVRVYGEGNVERFDRPIPVTIDVPSEQACCASDDHPATRLVHPFLDADDGAVAVCEDDAHIPFAADLVSHIEPLP